MGEKEKPTVAGCPHRSCGTDWAALSSSAVRLEQDQTESLLLMTGAPCGSMSVSQMVRDEESGPSPRVSGADLGSLKVDGELVCSLHLLPVWESGLLRDSLSSSELPELAR